MSNHKYFDSETQIEQTKEDSQAWGAISGILLTIVASGLLLMIVSVALTL